MILGPPCVGGCSGMRLAPNVISFAFSGSVNLTYRYCTPGVDLGCPDAVSGFNSPGVFMPPPLPPPPPVPGPSALFLFDAGLTGLVIVPRARRLRLIGAHRWLRDGAPRQGPRADRPMSWRRPNAARVLGQPELPLAAPKARAWGLEPEQAAKVAIARRAKPGAPPGYVRLVLSLELRRALAEELSARAIREGKNLEGVVIDLLEAGSRR